MTKNSEKNHPSHGWMFHPNLSPAEILQSLKDNTGSFSNKTKMTEKEFLEVFFNFFIEYFYIKENSELKDFMNSLERAILVRMLDRFNGNQKDTAEFLSVNHTTLNQKVRKHKIGFFKKPVEG